MGSVRVRKENSLLFFDFRYQGARCREQTLLKDNVHNRKVMQKVLDQIEGDIAQGVFDYVKYFPNSTVTICAKTKESAKETAPRATGSAPLFKAFAQEWFDENTIQWKRSYRTTIGYTLNSYLIPTFGEETVDRITKGDILKFRSSLAKVQNGTKEGLSPDRINHIMTPLRMIVDEAADRHNFSTPFVGIKQLKVRKTEIDPFSIDEVNLIIAKVRADLKNYYTVRALQQNLWVDSGSGSFPRV